jgi:hydrogenase maturation protease
MNPLVIGYGNPLRQDDGLGWHIARGLNALAASRAIGPLGVIASQQLRPEHTVAIASSSAVLFVDAACQRNPGQLDPGPPEPLRLESIELGLEPAPTCRILAEPQTGCHGQPLSHQLRPEALLQLTWLLEGRHPPGWTLAIPGQWFGFGELLSPMAARGMEAAQVLIAQWAHERSDHA